MFTQTGCLRPFVMQVRSFVLLAVVVVIVLFLDLDVQPFNFLIQGRKRHVKAFRGLSLIPATLFQHVDDDASLTIFHDVEQ